MPNQPIETGDKLHVMTRRLFLDDIRRHFAGEVISSGEGLFELKGYAFVYNVGSDRYQKRPEVRTRIFSFVDGIHIINKLPREVAIDSIHYNMIEGRLTVTDLKDLSLDINEFGLNS